MKKKNIVITISLLVVIVVVGIGAFFKASAYQPTVNAKLVAQTSQETKDYYLISSKNANKGKLIFYPGALVTPQSYSLWAKKLANNGYQVYILKLPLNMAIFAPNKAQKIISQHPHEEYVLAGHSLGGVMASRFAAQHPHQVAGMIYLASYPDKKGTLKNTGIPVLSLTASRDGVLNQSQYAKAKKLLPQQTEYISIKGGNHGGFGSYGHQKGDHQPKISNQKQQTIIAEQISNWLNAKNHA
ncbi:alpha/beta fold hydrolase [Latilactobacillus graminis]|uniref:Alpha/beta hydrolase fold-5 domain-containing protein n=2 Tax=Latilactobacillus graminis TaxID=60519 RepID=A0AA89I2W6_9LACO|nr:alpha/beta fold hydrolase [Latilactobacillus graminis]KRM23633.1 hypothetical protein FC90_GL000097 [Latilactobacillus graminis DSM 20719]QFP80175.1 alpha/beta hydrolase [Latilactobacillus graminis]